MTETVGLLLDGRNHLGRIRLVVDEEDQEAFPERLSMAETSGERAETHCLFNATI
jgi:hypothetical protein